MKPTTKKPAGWTAIRQTLTAAEKPVLIAMIKELYDAASMNRDLLRARVLTGADDPELLEKYRSKIEEQFFPARGIGKLKLGEARKAIRDYRKITGSIPGTAELLMFYVENGAKFTREYGDIDECFYNSIESALGDLAILLRGEARELYPHFADRLDVVEQMSDCVGWCFHDNIADIVDELAAELDKSHPENHQT